MYNLAIKAFFFSQTSDEMEVFILSLWIAIEETKGQGNQQGEGEMEELSRTRRKVESEGPGRRDIDSTN